MPKARRPVGPHREGQRHGGPARQTDHHCSIVATHLGHMTAEQTGARSFAARDTPAKVGNGTRAGLLELKLLQLLLEPLQGL